MTEAEWLALEDAESLLEFIRGKSSDRKRRLFAAAWYTRLFLASADPEAVDAIDLAERLADGNATERERDSQHPNDPDNVDRDEWAVVYYPEGAGWALLGLWSDGRSRSRDGDVFLDIFGNPFRSVTFAPEWRTDTATAIARQVYESREFSAMPILADALQDAGCDNPDILAHCRDPQATHVRGCRVVDLVLGKE